MDSAPLPPAVWPTRWHRDVCWPGSPSSQRRGGGTSPEIRALQGPKAGEIRLVPKPPQQQGRPLRRPSNKAALEDHNGVSHSSGRDAEQQHPRVHKRAVAVCLPMRSVKEVNEVVVFQGKYTEG